MFVKKLVLKNFKSFPSATVEFDEGFTAVVGPNGSGKSNVIDALLFSFGESSLKSMRVKKTSDLVFKDHGAAEVSAVFEGGEKPLEVKRLVRKDGKTKYGFGGKRVKKYVIDEFLAKNRISLHHVIKQGEVQRIVEMNPKERRGMIDFVANVAEYEEKKKEALSELERVEGKLREAKTLFAEREGYLNELKSEKEAAERFLALEARAKSLKATLLRIDLTELEKEFEAVVAALVEGNNRLEATQKSISDIEARIAQKQKAIDEVNKQITDRSQGKEIELQKEIDGLSALLERNAALIEEKRTGIGKNETRLHELLLEKTRAGDEVKGALKRLGELKDELKAVEKIVGEESASLNSLYKESNAFSQSFQDARRALDEANAEMLSCKEFLNALQAEISKQQEIRRLKENELERLKRGEGFEDFEPRKKELRELIRSADAVLKESDERLSALFEGERKANAALSEAEDLVLKASEKIAEKQALIRSSRDGGALADVVPELKRNVRGIHGTLQELCSFSAEYSLPVSVALGNRLNYVVVEDAGVAGKAIDFLKASRAGRVSFIPLNKIVPASKPDKSLLEEKGAVAFVKDLLEYDARFEKAFSFACANTLLTTDLKSAEKLIGEARLVTKDGELIEQAGLITGGFTQQKTNVFVEARELKDWEEKLESAKKQKNDLLDGLQKIRSETGEFRKRKAEAELRKKAGEIELRSVEEREDEEIRKRADVSGAVKQLRNEVRNCDNAQNKADEERAALIRKLSDLNIRALGAKERLDIEKEAKFGTAIKEREHKLSEYRVSASDLANQIKALEAQHAVYERALQSVLKQEADLSNEIRESENALKNADAEIKKARVALSEKTSEQKKISEAMKELIEAREEVQKQVMALGNEKGRLQFALEKITRSKQEDDVKRAVVETRLAELKAQYAAFGETPLVEEKNRVEFKPELVFELKQSEEGIAALGAVNLRAIEAYGQRVRELEEQKLRLEQLGNEKNAVVSIITEIEGKKISVFMQFFNAINANFAQLFKQIFAGDGTLFLENPENPFEGGLTIQARLEKSEVKYLELMSGGEKSLIALLFLFAIQSVNPTSIYVLDEADAALDQENSRKFVELLKKLSRKTQFVVVTHNETVFKNADCLVGVAMSKEGSKLVEVKLTEKGGSAELSTEGAEVEAAAQPNGKKIVSVG